MINLKNMFLSRITLQSVGNKLREEKNNYAKELFHVSEKEEEQFLPFFITPFKRQTEQYRFTHYTQDVSFNPLYSLSKELFNEDIDFVEYSNKALELLRERSNHPQIKSGEVFITLLNNIELGQGEKISGIGIFKLENKNKFIRFRHSETVECAIQNGFRLDTSIDKACLILNTQQDNGYIVLVHDDAKVESEYWKKSFLDIDYVHDDSYQTKNYIKLLEGFSRQIISEEKGKKTQVEFMSNCFQIFNEHETITEEILVQELLEGYDLVEEFKGYKKEYSEESNIQFHKDFEVSIPVLNREKKKIKADIKLDTSIQIKLDINKPEATENYLEQGYDEEKKMFYYKVYYNSEV